MNHRLSMKFIACYIFIGIIGFFLVTLCGSYFVERYLERDLSNVLYREVTNIASYDMVKNNLSEENLEKIRQPLSSLALFQGTVIWIINNKGEVLLSTSSRIDPNEPIPLKDFDASEWGRNYYQMGQFYGYFSADQMSVIAPITGDMATKGYAAIHYPLSSLYRTRSTVLQIIQFLFLAVYALTFLLMLVYRWHIYHPLKSIIKGASEYANGNLTYRIPIKSDDELGYLANTLNYMSEEMNRTGEYQRKFVSNISHDFRSPSPPSKVMWRRFWTARSLRNFRKSICVSSPPRRSVWKSSPGVS